MDIINADFTYPDVDDKDNFQEKIYKKREFYASKMNRNKAKSPNEIQLYREKICTGKASLLEQQVFLSNFINPDTPYRGALIFHGVGSGKCVDPETYIHYNNKVGQISSIWNKYARFIKTTNNEEWALPSKPIIINAYDEILDSIVQAPIKRLYRQYVNEKMILIKLENGLSLKMTKMHKIYKHYEWTNKFNINDDILIPSYIKSSNPINNIIHDIEFDEKYIPDEIMESSYESLARLLEKYTNYSTFDKNDIKYLIDTSSRLMTYQLYYLLKLFGINAEIQNNGIIVDKYDISKIRYNIKPNVLMSSKIISINEYDYNGYVYDFEIEHYHNYIANGILTHNTCAGITIAEQFKPMIKKYNTKIYVLVPGPLIKQNWKDELLMQSCTKNTYLRQQDLNVFTTEDEKNKAKQLALINAMQYYRFITYKSFYRKVLGEKIADKIKTTDNKIKTVYRKNEEGEFERDIAVDKLISLDNSVIMVDEAHNITGNSYGEALKMIIKNSVNLKVVLLTATPMTNTADEIIELLNMLRPIDDPIERDQIFTSQVNYEMELKPNGLQYLKNMSSGYVSYLRGADPLTFPKKVEMGIIPKSLKFTYIIPCNMLDFQLTTYKQAIHMQEDALDKKSEAVANFAFPVLSSDKKSLIGSYGREGIGILRNQLKTHADILNKRIAIEILRDKALENETDLLYLSDDGKTITGKILKIEYLKYFSIKFYRALKKINRLVWQKKGARTAFIYSNLVKVGIDLFKEILLQNGYLEYNSEMKYKYTSNTICYFCGKRYDNHDQIYHYNKDSSSEYEHKKGNIPKHEFHPATFLPVTGQSSEEGDEVIPEEKLQIIRSVFNSISNVDGKMIKFVLGSRVINEGISFKNISEIHVLDVYFNLGKVDQVIGRGIRHCSHMQLMSEENLYPQVKIYKYATSLGTNELSSEEELYRKAEIKYLLIKKIERALKENAIDCPLNMNKNIFDEEVNDYDGCKKIGEPLKSGEKYCPQICDFDNCVFKCSNKSLDKYYDQKNHNYKDLNKDEIDYSTFNNKLAKIEISSTKKMIIDLYKIDYVYTLTDIMNYIKDSIDKKKLELFDDFFVFKAIDELVPATENDFNNFTEPIFDKYGRQGYLIHVGKYYIFQPFDQNENVPMYYRTTYDKSLSAQATIYNYVKNMNIESDLTIEIQEGEIKSVYDYRSVMDYYDNKNEYKYVGIIDKEPISAKKPKDISELNDVFKIRNKRRKMDKKKRGTGIVTILGSVCFTARKYDELLKIAKELGISGTNLSKQGLCDSIRDKLIFLERYNKDNLTYLMIPANHPIYPFPLNVHDRKDYIINNIRNKIKILEPNNIKVIPQQIKIDNQNVQVYKIEINKELSEFKQILLDMNASNVGNKWIINVS